MVLKGSWRVTPKGTSQGDLKQDSEGDLLLSLAPGQFRSGQGQGLVQLRFSLQLKFNSLELDSEVG